MAKSRSMKIPTDELVSKPFDYFDAIHKKLDMLLEEKKSGPQGFEKLAGIEAALKTGTTLGAIGGTLDGFANSPRKTRSLNELVQNFEGLLSEGAQLSDELGYLANRLGTQNVFADVIPVAGSFSPDAPEEPTFHSRLTASVLRFEQLNNQLRRTLNALRDLEEGGLAGKNILAASR